MLDRTIAVTLRARDFMQTELLTVSPDSPILDVHRMFVEEEIHGAPVVDEDGVVCGVISSLDLLRVVREECAEDLVAASSYFRDQAPVAGMNWANAPEDFPERMKVLTAADAMTREIVSVSPDAPIAEVAQTMRQHHIHRVLVIEERELVGVLTSFDMLRAFIDDDRARAVCITAVH